MKTIIKKILVIMMTITLVFSSFAITIGATDANTVTLSLSHMGSQDNFGRYLIYFDGATAAQIEDPGDIWNNNTLFVDGVEKTDVYYIINDNRITLLLTYDLLEEGVTEAADIGKHTVWIKSGTVIGNLTVQNDVAFTVQQGACNALKTTTLTCTSVADQVPLSRYLIYYNVNAATANLADIYWDNNVAYIDGEGHTDDIHYAVDGTQVFMVLPYGDLQEGATSSGEIYSHSIVIQAGTVLNDYFVTEDVSINIKNSSGYLSPLDTTLSFDHAGCQDNLARYLIYFNVDAATVNLPDIYSGGNRIFIDGQVTDSAVNYVADGQQLFLLLPYSLLEQGVTTAAAMGEHLITIPAGALADLNILEDISVKVNGAHCQPYVEATQLTVALSNDWRNTQGTTADGLFFTVSPADPLAYDTANWTARYNMTTGGIAVNGETVSGARLVKITDTLYYIAFDGTGVTFDAGDRVSIAGTVQTSEAIVTYTETIFEYNGEGNWELYTPPQELIGTPSWYDADTGTANGFFFLSDDGFPHDENWATNIYPSDGGENGVFLNNEKTDAFLKKITPNRYYVCLGDRNVTPLDGDAVTVKGKFATEGGTEITFEEYTVYFDGITWMQSPDTNSYVSFVINNVDVNSGYNGSAGVWCVYFHTSSDLPGGADDTYFDTIDLEIYNESTAQTEQTSARLFNSAMSGGTLMMALESDKLPYPLTANTKITLKAGKILPTQREYTGADQNIGIKLVEDYTVYVDTYGQNNSIVAFSGEGYYINASANVSVTLSETDFTSATGFTFHATDSMPYDNSWAERTYAADGNENGVFINGEKSAVYLKKYNTEYYYVCLADAAVTAVAGDILEVKGKFANGNNTVAFNAAKFVFDGEKWVQKTYSIIGATGIDGDINADGVFDIRDFIRYKKYFADFTISINETDADFNSDGKIDITDLVISCKTLLGVYVFQNSSNITPGAPDYSASNAVLPIGAYCGPRRIGGQGTYSDGTELGTQSVDFRTVENFQLYAAAGLNFVISEGDAYYEENWGQTGRTTWDWTNGGSGGDFNTSDIKKYMDAAQQAGVDVIVASSHLNELLRGTSLTWDTKEQSRLINMMNNLKQYDNFKGLMMSDEPNSSDYEDYLTIATWMRSNLDLEGKLLMTSLESNTGFTNAEYVNYLNRYGDLLGFSAFDIYPLLQTRKLFRTDKSLLPNYLENLQIVASNAQGKYETGVTMQSYSGYAKAWENSLYNKTIRRSPSKADISFQMYSALAYGMKRITYFTYWEHFNQNNELFTDYMVTYPTDGSTLAKTTPLYNYVKEVNTEVQKFSNAYMNFTWQGTVALPQSDSDGMLAKLESYSSPRIASAVSSNDAIVGCLKDTEGYDGFMIVNATDPADSKTAVVTLKFKNADHATVYVNGEPTTVALNDGSYTVTLAPGEGVFAIPYIAQ